MREILAKTHIRLWLAIVGSSTLVLLAGYVIAQQSTRLSANDIPLSLAQQTKSDLENGSIPQDVVSARKISIDSNNNSFVIITDSSRHVLASSAVLDGKTPLPPEGVFEYTSEHQTDKVTWQPKAAVRSAIYATTYGKSPDNGFVIAGQSLKPYEDRIGVYANLVVVAWLAVIAWTSALILIPKNRG